MVFEFLIYYYYIFLFFTLFLVMGWVFELEGESDVRVFFCINGEIEGFWLGIGI